MGNSIKIGMRILLPLAVWGMLAPVNAADAKPDRKKSQAAYQRGVKADAAGRPEEAMAAYAEAIEADGANAVCTARRHQEGPQNL